MVVMCGSEGSAAEQQRSREQKRRMDMKCEFCQRIVTQSEADEATKIYDAGVTLHPKCAETMKETAELARVDHGQTR